MFEQQLYDQEVSEIRTQPGDLFHEYEIREWNLTPLHYKILGFSAVFNILALVVIGSSGLLTARGCDSPFVGRVCQVLDTVYVGSLIFGTERDYVDAPYEKTDLGDVEVTFVDVTGVTPPLTYPAGYFQLANPEQFANVTDPMAGFGPNMIPGIPNPTLGNPTIGGRGLINTPPVSAKVNPNAIDGKLPTDPLGTAEDNPTITGKGKGPGGPLKTDKTEDANVAKADEKEEPTVDPTKPLTEKDINRRPFVDLAGAVNAMLANPEFRLDTEFSVTAKGKLNKEGRLDKKTFKFTKAASSDPKMVDVVKQSVEAFNDSGMLQYLEQLSGKDLNLAIAQDKENIFGEVRSEVERDTRAQGLASALRIGLQFSIGNKEKKIAALQAENNPDKAQDLQNTLDELELLRKTEIVAEGKYLVVKFTSPKGIMHNLIQRKLDAQAKEVKKESGVGPVGMNNNTAKKID